MRATTLFRPRDGQSVTCPEDRGDPAYRGIVESCGTTVHRNVSGHPYVWVTVRNPHGGRKSVWPSNRLAG